MVKLLKAIELEHQSLVQWLVPRVFGIPEPYPFCVEDDLVTSLGWQGLEKAVGVEVVVPVLHIVRGVGRGKWSVPGYCFFRKMHSPRGTMVIWSQTAEVSAVSVWS